MTRRAIPLLLIGALAAALIGPIGVVTPAAAAVTCTPSFGTNFDPANPADPSIYVAETAVDTPAVFDLTGMCFPTDPSLSIISASPGAGSVAFDQIDENYAQVTYGQPAGFIGVADLRLTIEFGGEARDYRFVVYTGVPGATFPTISSDPQNGSVGVATSYDLTGLSFPSGSPELTVLNPSSQFSATLLPGATAFEVTPLQNVGGPFEARVVIDNGIQGREYRVILWVGAPVPDRVVWGPQPEPVQIDPRGTGYFTLTNFAPPLTECEIQVTTDPDIDIVTEPARLNGLPSRIAVRVLDDYVGLLTVHYVLSCEEPGGVTSRDFVMRLYVGIPIPALAATGTSLAGPAAVASVLMITGLLLLRRRRAATR